MSTAVALNIPVQIQRYFDTLNGRAFEQTAALFAPDGQLVPPFEKPIQGRDAIAQYLTAEASEMTFTPSESELLAPDVEEGEPACIQTWIVKGKVKTSLFTVNVAWQFELSMTALETRENNSSIQPSIQTVKIKLIASLNELLKFKR